MRRLLLATLACASLLGGHRADAEEAPPVVLDLEALARRIDDAPRPLLGLIERAGTWERWGPVYAPWQAPTAPSTDPWEEEEEPFDPGAELTAFVEEATGGAWRPVPHAHRLLLRWTRGAWPASAWRDRLATDLLQRVVVDVVVRSPGGGQARGEIHTSPGRRGAFARTPVLRVVPDYDVEIACDNSGGFHPSALGCPVPVSLLEGMSLDVRPHLLEGGRRIALEVVAQAGRFDRPARRMSTDARFLGQVDLPVYRGMVAVGSGSVRDGETLRWRFGGVGHGNWDVRLTPRLVEVPSGGAVGGPLRSLDASFLLRPKVRPTHHPDDRSEVERTWSPRLETVEPVFDASTLAEMLGVHIEHVHVSEGGRVLLAGDEAAYQRARRLLDACAGQAGRTVHLDLVARTPDETLARASISVLSGHRAWIRMGRDRTLLLGSDSEVG